MCSESSSETCLFRMGAAAQNRAEDPRSFAHQHPQIQPCVGSAERADDHHATAARNRLEIRAEIRCADKIENDICATTPAGSVDFAHEGVGLEHCRQPKPHGFLTLRIGAQGPPYSR